MDEMVRHIDYPATALGQTEMQRQVSLLQM
jgi:hypothetical protein